MNRHSVIGKLILVPRDKFQAFCGLAGLNRRFDQFADQVTKLEERLSAFEAKCQRVPERVNEIFWHTQQVGVQTIQLDYPVKSTPRYGWKKPPHALLHDMINRSRAQYQKTLEGFLELKDDFLKIPVANPAQPGDPCWRNGWLPGLDEVAIYAFLIQRKPKRYLEVGSGNSTKFARRAILDHHLPTQILSIDPHPRAEVDRLCDHVVRKPLEDADLSVFDELEAGDVVFVDNSHRCFMNSDVTVFFLDILPSRLKPGVLVQVHDIFLPYDYPESYVRFYYSEQYMLSAYILGDDGRKIDIVLPNTFISNDPELSRILQPLWDSPQMKGAESHGCSFWFETR